MRFLFLLFFPFITFGADVTYIQPRAYLDVVLGKMISGKVIGIEKDIIVSISDFAPPGKKVLKFDEQYLLPGLIDCHTHVFFTQTLEDKNFETALLRELKLSDTDRIVRAKIFMRQYLDSGFTSICDLGNSGQFLDVRLRDEIQSDPLYPQLFVSGPGISSYHGQFAANARPEQVEKEYTIVDHNTDVELMLKSYSQKKIDILKIYIDNSPGAGHIDANVLNKILNSSILKNFKKVTFHAIDQSSVNRLLALNKNLNIEHGNGYGWKKLNNIIYLTLTDLPIGMLKEFNYYNQIFYTGQVIRAKEAYSNAIKLVFGTDFYFHKNNVVFNRGKYAIDTIEAWQAASIPPVDIIRAMTINPARSLGLDKLVGVIRIGAKANLIGVKYDPLKDINSLKNISFIINKGRIIDRLQEKH